MMMAAVSQRVQQPHFLPHGHATGKKMKKNGDGGGDGDDGDEYYYYYYVKVSVSELAFESSDDENQQVQRRHTCTVLWWRIVRSVMDDFSHGHCCVIWMAIMNIRHDLCQ
jgi:hypothetical protein